MTITALTPSKRDASKLTVKVNGRAVGTLAAKQAEALGLEVGGAWDEALAARVAEAVAFGVAFDRAMKLVNRRAMSKAALARKLSQQGHEAGVVERVVEKLLAIGAISDESLARTLVDEIDRARPAGPALKRAKLAQRGVEEDVIERVIGQAESPAKQREDARRLVASKMKSIARLDEVTRRRRLWSLLARRGFDEEVIEAVVGTIESDE